MIYENCKVYGPYLHNSKISQGRKYIQIYFPDGHREKTLYSRYLMEVHLNRRLSTTETVDHIDRDFTNDSLSNLRVVQLNDHLRQDAKRVSFDPCICPTCGKEIEVDSYKYSRVKRGISSALFCSHHCAAVYRLEVRYGRRDPITNFPLVKHVHYQRK